MKTLAILWTAIALILFMSVIAHGQTNSWTDTNNSTYQILTNGGQWRIMANPNTTTAQDFSKLLSDFGINIDFKTVMAIWTLIYFVGKFARNKTPLGQGAIGQVLSTVVNLEAKQSQPKPQQPQQKQ